MFIRVPDAEGSRAVRVRSRRELFSGHVNPSTLCWAVDKSKIYVPHPGKPGWAHLFMVSPSDFARDFELAPQGEPKVRLDKEPLVVDDEDEKKPAAPPPAPSTQPAAPPAPATDDSASPAPDADVQ